MLGYDFYDSINLLTGETQEDHEWALIYGIRKRYQKFRILSSGIFVYQTVIQPQLNLSSIFILMRVCSSVSSIFIWMLGLMLLGIFPRKELVDGFQEDWKRLVQNITADDYHENWKEFDSKYSR